MQALYIVIIGYYCLRNKVGKPLVADRNAFESELQDVLTNHHVFLLTISESTLIELTNKTCKNNHNWTQFLSGNKFAIKFHRH